MVTHTLTSVPLWSHKRFCRLLILATISGMIVASVFLRFEMQRWSWPTSAIAGIGLAGLVVVHARTSHDAHRGLWMVLAILPTVFWSLAMVLTVGSWFD